MSGSRRYRIVEGSSREFAIGSGGTLRVETKAVGGLAAGAEQPGGQTRLDVAADADGNATLTPGAAGVYYLATFESATAPLVRAGTLYVDALFDTQEERLIAELALLDDRIGKTESMLHGVQSPDGTALQRTMLGSLRKQRAFASAKLWDFRRRRDGRAPVDMRG